jgi:hypothetical protein
VPELPIETYAQDEPPSAAARHVEDVSPVESASKFFWLPAPQAGAL